MCEICRKYQCPSGCPNNYTPQRRKKDKGARDRAYGYTVTARVFAGGGGYSGVLIDKSKITMKSEIKSDKKESEGSDDK